MRTLLGTCAILVAGLAAVGADQVDLAPYLPKKDLVVGGLYEVGAPPKAAALGAKMAEAVRGKEEWLKKYIEDSAAQKPGQILPYHPNFGITADEYETIIAAMGKMSLNKVGDVKLRFARNASGVAIGFEGKGVPIKSVRVFYKQDLVQTQRMKLKERVPIDQDKPESPTGRWEGVQWRHLQGKTLETRFSEKFAIGKMKDKAQGIIYYDLRAADQNAASMIVLYDLK